jgi:hypothetical protein
MIEEEGLDNILARHHYGARGSGAPVRAERSVTLKTTAPSEPQQRENRAHRNQGRGFGDRIVNAIGSPRTRSCFSLTVILGPSPRDTPNDRCAARLTMLLSRTSPA